MKNLTYKISLLILGLFAAVAVNAQEIRGVVSDVNGEPLIGVSVFVDGTTTGTATGVDGDYVINIPSAKGKTLVFSMIGLSEKRVVIGTSTTINVTLEEDLLHLRDFERRTKREIIWKHRQEETMWGQRSLLSG